MIDETKIMQYADGTLPEEEKETVKKAIENDPQLQKLLKDYQETGEILFNLGKEIKSQPLPSSLKDKLKTINEEKSKDTKKPFIFFRIPKIAYAGITAVFALILYSVFSTQAPLMVEKNDRILNLAAFKNIDRPKFIDSTESTSNTQGSVDVSHRMLDINKIKNSHNDYISHYKVEKFLEEKFSNGGIAKKLGRFAKSAFMGGDAKTVYKDWHKSVFYVANSSAIHVDETSGEAWMGSLGTGSLVDRSGLIITNWHVIEGAKQVWIYPFPKEGLGTVLHDSTRLIGRIVAQSKKTDLALVQVTGLSPSIKAVSLGTLRDIVPGEDVFAIGHPHGTYTWSITDGIVNQIRSEFCWDYVEEDMNCESTDPVADHKATLIQNNAQISAGNSGGPLFNEQGKMIGINSWSEPGAQNLNMAIAVSHVKKLIQNREKPGTKTEVSLNPLTVKKLIETYPNYRAGDINENGENDYYWADTDNEKVGPEGPGDTLFIDGDEDNIIEELRVDMNENGFWEEILFDDDLDGTPEYKIIDEDEDGVWDTEAFDKDQDGEWDIFQELKS